MQRHTLEPRGSIPEQIPIASPRRVSEWTLAQRHRRLHRLLVPIDASLRAFDALHYIVEELAHHVAGVHVVNVQSPVMSGSITPLISVQTITALREAEGQRILALAREVFSGSAILLTGEVAFGAAAETICRVAHEGRCTGIVIARDGFALHDLIGGSVAAKVLRLATVPVTIVNARTTAAVMERQPRRLESKRSPTGVRARPVRTTDRNHNESYSIG